MAEKLIGCCGLQGKQADYYAEFPVVEVQRTFYQTPRLELARKWRTESPEDFIFTMKAWQLITHRASSPTYRRLKEKVPGRTDAYGDFQDTPEVRAAWERTLEWGVALGCRVVVFQCPRSFTPTEQSQTAVRAFFTSIERGEMAFAWEPRGWPDDLVGGLCRELDLVHCVDPFINRQQHGSFAYFRLHGRPAYRYRYHYSVEDLDEIQHFVANAEQEGRSPIYVMFNNWWLLEDARRFKALGP